MCLFVLHAPLDPAARLCGWLGAQMGRQAHDVWRNGSMDLLLLVSTMVETLTAVATAATMPDARTGTWVSDFDPMGRWTTLSGMVDAVLADTPAFASRSVGFHNAATRAWMRVLQDSPQRRASGEAGALLNALLAGVTQGGTMMPLWAQGDSTGWLGNVARTAMNEGWAAWCLVGAEGRTEEPDARLVPLLRAMLAAAPPPDTEFLAVSVVTSVPQALAVLDRRMLNGGADARRDRAARRL